MLADPSHKIAERVDKARLADADVTRLESLIDQCEGEVPPLRRFILAGGAPAGAALHVARTVCRRAERRIVSLQPPPDPLAVRYVNRLSDLLFAMARTLNHRVGAPETEW
jgi:cob(I)alamin adenosyltransferase